MGEHHGGVSIELERDDHYTVPDALAQFSRLPLVLPQAVESRVGRSWAASTLALWKYLLDSELG